MMDLSKKGKMLREMRKACGLTQKQVADRLGITAKTVSKWETGRGFPDVSSISSLAAVFGVSERMILTEDITKNKVQAGNIRRTKFYLCQSCGSNLEVMGESEIICCGNRLRPLSAKKADSAHIATLSELEDELYIEFSHDMTKEHYISFVTYIGFDKKITAKLYPEQDAAIRLPKIPRGKLYFCCTQHGLFEITTG